MKDFDERRKELKRQDITEYWQTVIGKIPRQKVCYQIKTVNASGIELMAEINLDGERVLIRPRKNAYYAKRKPIVIKLPS